MSPPCPLFTQLVRLAQTSPFPPGPPPAQHTSGAVHAPAVPQPANVPVPGVPLSMVNGTPPPSPPEPPLVAPEAPVPLPLPLPLPVLPLLPLPASDPPALEVVPPPHAHAMAAAATPNDRTKTARSDFMISPF